MWVQMVSRNEYRCFGIGRRGAAGGHGELRRPEVAMHPASDLDSFLDDRLAEDWDGGQPIRSELSVSGTINRFRPQDVPDELWAEVRDIVREAVRKEKPKTPFLADNHMTVLSQLVVWAHRIGQPLTPEVLFDPETIDRFLIEGCAHLKDGSRINYRTTLWKVGRAVRGRDLFPERPVSLKRSALTPPFAEYEVTELVSWARGLPTPHMRRNAQALIVIGLGAGLTSQEVQRLVGDDISEADGRVVVQVIGEKERQVPVLEEWASEVLRFARESGPRPYFCPERRRITRRDVIGFIERCSDEDTARFNVQRLRVTWIVHHLSVGTHLIPFVEMAGVGAGQLVKYLDFATTPPEASGTRVDRPLRLLDDAKRAAEVPSIADA